VGGGWDPAATVAAAPFVSTWRAGGRGRGGGKRVQGRAVGVEAEEGGGLHLLGWGPAAAAATAAVVAAPFGRTWWAGGRGWCGGKGGQGRAAGGVAERVEG